MAKIVRNPLGGVHSVPDDFEFPIVDGDGNPAGGWEELTEDDAPAYLLGTEADPAVVAVESHDGGGDIPDQTSTGHVGDGPLPTSDAAPAADETDTETDEEAGE